MLDLLNEEDILLSLQFDWDQITSLPKTIAAYIIGLAVIDSKAYSCCPENHLHIYLLDLGEPPEKEATHEVPQIFQ